MSKINPIRKRKVKTNLLKGKSARKSMIEAGYAESTAKNATDKKVVKVCLKEILKEYDTKDITIDNVLKMLLDIIDLAKSKGDIANYNRAVETISRHLGMLKPDTNTEININTSDLFSNILAHRRKRAQSIDTQAVKED